MMTQGPGSGLAQSDQAQLSAVIEKSKRWSSSRPFMQILQQKRNTSDQKLLKSGF